jgi:hypothetical protein
LAEAVGDATAAQSCGENVAFTVEAELAHSGILRELGST